MPIEIAGQQFTGFPGLDSVHLRNLNYRDRIRWFKYRFGRVFLTPFAEFRKLERPDCYIWLCVVNLVCSAIEALSRFQFEGSSDRDCFVQFVEKYFAPAFQQPKLSLYDPRPEKGREASTSAEHLYKYFRSGLAHSFCIEWGGILHREDGALNYIFAADTSPGAEKSLGVVPRELVDDFLSAINLFFRALEAASPSSPLQVQFTKRFDEVFLTKAGPSIP